MEKRHLRLDIDDENFDAEFQRFLDARRDAYIEKTFGRRETTAREPEATPSVSRFRDMIGDTT